MNTSKSTTALNDGIFTDDEILKLRLETAGCKFVNHLNNAGAGLMPDVVTKAQIAHLKLESEIGGYEAAAVKQTLIREFYSEAALLLNCSSFNIAFTSSATDAYTRALSSIPFNTGDVILTDRDDFVSNQIQFLSLQKRFGLKIIHINNAEVGGVDLNDLAEKLNTNKPRLLAITHIPTNSGLVQPVDAIARIFGAYAERYRDKTWYILDACQSVGQIKLDVMKLKCDFMSFTCRKFLRGPRGTGALYISDYVLNSGLEPLFIDMRGAEWTNRDEYERQPDAKRFEDWEFAYSTVIGTMEAIRYCRNVGEDRIWQRVKFLSGMLRNKLNSMDSIRVLDMGEAKGASVTFYAEHQKPEHLVQELVKRKINVVASYRAYGLLDFDDKGVEWAVRVSPHYYNTVGEIDQFTQSLTKIMTK
ncbi:MAG: aminotransferase class V-fold PLP-dependent enzyme [Chryseolinea sp.]